jgi:hypothetical protein
MQLIGMMKGNDKTNIEASQKPNITWNCQPRFERESIDWSSTYMKWAILEMNHQSFLMHRPSSRKDHLLAWNKSICHKIGAVHFCIICESVYNIDVDRIPYDRKHEFLLWTSSLDFVAISFLDRIHIRRGGVLKKNQDSSPVTRWCQPSRLPACKNGNIARASSFHFSRKSSVQRCGT